MNGAINGYGNLMEIKTSSCASFGIKAIGILDAVLSRYLPIWAIPSPVYNSLLSITDSKPIIY